MNTQSIPIPTSAAKKNVATYSKIYRRQTSRQSDPNTELWMITLGDLITLLFCFFIALRATNSMTSRSETESINGPVVADKSSTDGGASIFQHHQTKSSDIKIWIGQEDLIETEKLHDRIRSLVPRDKGVLLIRLVSCRSPLSSLLVSDLGAMERATRGFQVTRTVMIDEALCKHDSLKRTFGQISLELAQ